MFAQLMRCLCRCVPRREGARAGAPGAPAESGETEVPAGLESLLDIPGIGPRTLNHLAEAGYRTVDDVRAASEEELAAIEGVGRRAANLLKRSFRQ